MAISLTQSGVAYTQDFNTLASSGASVTNALAIEGWEILETGTSARRNDQYAVDNGGSNAADIYSYGATGSTDRALGQLRSGTLVATIGASFTNNTGATITSLQIGYTGEQWRLGTAGRADKIDFEYSLNATSLATGTWTSVDALDFSSPNTVAPLNAKDGNDAANRTALSTTITGLNIPAGATFYIRWIDTDAGGADDGLAIDDFSLTAITGAALPTLSINDRTVVEGDAGTTTVAFTVSLSAPAPAGGVTFDIATADGTATVAGADYVANSLTSQTIPAGSTTYTFNVTVHGDTAFEPNEGFLVNVTNVVGATLSDGQGAGTITNDDVAVVPGTLSVADVSVAEGDVGTTAGAFTVTRTGGANGAVSANYTITLPGGAGGANATDVTATLTGTVSLADGQTSATIPFTINGDRTVEPNETFTVALSAPTGGASLGTANATATITNDDVAGTVSIANVAIGEGGGNAVLTLTRTGGAGDFTVDFATADGTATVAGSDYLANAGTITFTGGATTAQIGVAINQDAIVEPDETLTVNLTNPTSGATITGPTAATVTIVDDDSGVAPGSVSIADAQIIEGNAGTGILLLTLTRAGGTGAFTVDFATAASTDPQFASATAGTDYVATSGTVTFGTGVTTQTVAVTINGDTIVELSEQFRVLLSNATGGATIGDGSAIATITNDDMPPASQRLLAENFATFTAAGFAPMPAAGQLDSDVWRVVGLSDNASPTYGFTATTGDFARGTLADGTNPVTAGVYSPAGNAALIIQPTGAELDSNGFIEARVQNTTGSTQSAFDIAFDWTFRNNETRASNLQFSYSTDGTTFITVPTANFSTPDAANSTTFVRQNQLAAITGVSVVDQGFLVLRWTHLTSSGSGSRDEVGIDNITVDTAGGVATPLVAVSDVAVNEDLGTMTFTVTRTNQVGGTFSVNYATADGTATAGSDYTATTGTLNFAANQISANVTVAITPDATPEFDETVRLNLSGASGANIADAQGVGTIVNDDGAPITVSIGDVTVTEGQAGTSIATFTVTRTGGTGAFDVNFATANGTAIAGSDYLASTGMLNFAIGQNSQTIAVTINGDVQSELNETFTVNLSGATGGALFADASATGTIVNDDSTLISAIQGSSYFSPFVAAQGITTFNTATTTTVTVTAIVTVLDGDGMRQGFYLTEESADWDVSNLTSEGIFVMTRNDAGVGSTLLAAIPGLAVGDRVTVTANVVEYQGFATSMPVTTLVNPVVQINANAQPLPILTLDASRPIPNTIVTGVTPVYTDSVDDPGDSFDAVNYALSFYETVEGMLVTIPDLVVADGFVSTSGGQPFFKVYSTVHANPEQINSRGGYTIAGDPALAPPDTANPLDGLLNDGRSATDGDINPDIFEIDFTDFAIDAPAGLATSASMGDRLGTASGILNFDFQDIKLFVTAINPASFVNTQPVQEVTALGSDSRALTIATFNVENLDPTDGAARFTAIANVIVNNLKSPDILTIEEIQDNNGAAAGSADASLTWQMLVDALNLASGKVYQWVDQEPVNGAEGGEPGGNIRVGFLYDTARVQLGDLAAGATLAERRQFTDRIGDGVRDAGDRILYSDNMIGGELNTTDWSGTRKSLLGQFTFAGNTVFVTANHLPAKGGSGQLWQFNQNIESGQPANSDWAQRTAIAQDLYALNALIETSTPGVGVVVAGDINEFYFYRPLTTLTGHTLADGTARVGGPRFDNLTVTKLTEAERYTYTFDGRSQAIDHIIVSNALNAVATYDIVHINTGFNPTGTPALSDHDPAVASFDYRSFGETLNGTSASETIMGFGGNDTIDGRGGTDTLVGGTGNDIYIIDSLDDVVTELAGEGTADEVRTALVNYVLPANVEILTFTGTAPNQPTTVRGNAGNNTLNGGASADAFNLSDGGTDTVGGGDGNDSFAFGATFDPTDRVTGGTGGNDQIGLQGNYTGENALTINGTMLNGVEVLAVLSGFSYALTTTQDLVAPGVRMSIYAGTLGVGDAFSFNGSAETDGGSFYIIGGGGTDTIVGGSGNDAVFFGPGKFDAATDTVDGGAGTNDQLGLDGNYSVTLTGSIANVEVVALLPGVAGDLGSYTITLADSFTPGTLTRTISGTQVQTAITVNASAETDGNIRIFGGVAGDILTGGNGADFFFGNLGTDAMFGGLGADVFLFENAAQSTGLGRDTIGGFTSEDRIQLTTTVAAVDTAITAGSISNQSFDTDLSAAVNASTLGANNAVLFTASGGTLSGRTFLVIDSNGTAGYQAGLDIVIELQTPPASISVANFIV